MTISDDDLAKWDARSRSTYAGLRNSVPVAQIIGELRDARRKLAAVEKLCDEREHEYIENWMGLNNNRPPKDPEQAMLCLFQIRAALAAGEAPTEPATCRHCLNAGPAGEDHSCACPFTDAECTDHPAPRCSARFGLSCCKLPPGHVGEHRGDGARWARDLGLVPQGGTE